MRHSENAKSKFKTSAKAAALSALMCLSACSGGEAVTETQSASPVAETTTEATEVETTTTAAETEAVTENAADMEEYMEYVNSVIDEEIFEVRNTKRVEAYGGFESYTYYSTTAERDTKVNVLLPPDYSEDKEYPVLYILHGFYDNEDWMARRTVGIPEMLTMLYESGDAEEMIVVLPYIFTSKEMPTCTGMDEKNCLAYDNFINDLTTDLMPFIESSFSVKKGRENTAITGFSMGGRESLFIGVSRPDLFGYVGACCPAPGLVPIPGSPMHSGQLQNEELTFGQGEAPKVLFISAGGNDGVVGDSPKSYYDLFTSNGVKSFYQLMDGTTHDHTSVTPHLYKYLQMIFK